MDAISQDNFTEYYFDYSPEMTQTTLDFVFEQYAALMMRLDSVTQLRDNRSRVSEIDDVARIGFVFVNCLRLLTTTRAKQIFENKFADLLKENNIIDGFDRKNIQHYKLVIHRWIYEKTENTVDSVTMESFIRFFLDSFEAYFHFQGKIDINNNLKSSIDTPNYTFRHLISRENTIFEWIGLNSVPVFVRLALLNEIILRKLKLATGRRLFSSTHHGQELHSMIRYGEILLERLENDTSVESNQFIQGPNSTKCVFLTRKTLFSVRFANSPREIIDNAHEALKSNAYRKDNIRSLYNIIWLNHAIMRAHMFRGDTIMVNIQENIIKTIVNQLEKNNLTQFHDYMEKWDITNHKDVRDRTYNNAENLQNLQKNYLKKTEKLTLRQRCLGPNNIQWSSDDEDLEKSYEALKYLDSNNKETDDWRKMDLFRIKSGKKYIAIFGRKRGPTKEQLKKIFDNMPEKYRECVDSLLTSETPLRIPFLRLITREYLLQLSKMMFFQSKKNREWFEVQYFQTSVLDKFVVHLNFLKDEFEMMEENLAVSEISKYTSILNQIQIEKVPTIANSLQNELRKISQNDKLYFPRRYPMFASK